MEAHGDERPLVSVVLPVRNGERWIRESLSSLREQTFQDFEVILVDDGCTDQSVNIARELAAPRMRIISGSGRGLASALARGVLAAEGEFIARLDVDDVSQPTRLRRQVAAFVSDPELVIVGSWAREIDERSQAVGVLKTPRSDRGIQIYSIIFNPFIHSSVMLRKSAVLKAGNYRSPDEGPYPEDFDLWVRMIRFGTALNLEECLVDYRRSGGSEMSTNDKLIRQRSAEICAESALSRFGADIAPAEDAFLLGYFHWRSGRVGFREAWRLVSLLVRLRRVFGWRPSRSRLTWSTYIKPFGWFIQDSWISVKTRGSGVHVG